MADDDSASVATSVRSVTRRRRQSILAKANDPAAHLEAATIDLRCLLVCGSLLERVNGVSIAASNRSQAVLSSSYRWEKRRFAITRSLQVS